MRIALDTRLLRSDDRPVLSEFTREIAHLIAVKHPEHEFIFLSDSARTNQIDLPKNAITVIITPKPTNLLLYKWWYDVKLPLVLRKFKVDVFLATTGICSLTAKVPQVLVIGDLAFLQKTFLNRTGGFAYYKSYTRRFLKKAKRIVTFTGYVREELNRKYGVDQEAIQSIGFGAGISFSPLSWEQREGIKETIADGCEYFFLPGSFLDAETLIKVLKAFSIFKRWQRTNMKLVIAGQFDAGFEKELEKLNSYKYRQAVCIKKSLTQKEMSEVVGAAYAMIFPVPYDGFAAPVLEAMKCDVPIITSRDRSISEIAGEGALYADTGLPEEVADQMKKMFKDEQLRRKLIEEGRERSTQFDWNKTAVLLWEVIEQAISK